ncbi:unnamed protein product, partial [Symbiodinium necroappetens]
MLASKFKNKGFFADMSPDAWLAYANYLLGEKVYLMQVPAGGKMDQAPLRPPWVVVLNYEYELRKEAIKRAYRDSRPLRETLREVTEDAHIKEQYFTSPIALQNRGKRASDSWEPWDDGNYNKWNRNTWKGGWQHKGDNDKGLRMVVSFALPSLDLGAMATVGWFIAVRLITYARTVHLAAGQIPSLEDPASIWQWSELRSLRTCCFARLVIIARLTDRSKVPRRRILPCKCLAMQVIKHSSGVFSSIGVFLNVQAEMHKVWTEDAAGTILREVRGVFKPGARGEKRARGIIIAVVLVEASIRASRSFTTSCTSTSPHFEPFDQNGLSFSSGTCFQPRSATWTVDTGIGSKTCDMGRSCSFKGLQHPELLTLSKLYNKLQPPLEASLPAVSLPLEANLPAVPVHLLSTPSPMDEEPMFQATHRSTYEQLQEQISRRAKGRNAVDYYEEGMSPLLAYMFFVLHYDENFLTINGIHEWPIIPHSAIRRFTDRVAWIQQFSVPMPRIRKEDVEQVLQFLLTRFGPADKPFLPMIPIGQREIVLLAKVILASKIPYREIFQHDAKAYALPQEALHVWQLPVAHLPGPEEQANRSSLEAVGSSQSDEILSFYGKASQ